MFERLKKFKETSEAYKKIAKYLDNKNSEDSAGSFLVYFICGCTAFILSVFNLRDGYSTMLVSTLLLTVGMLFCAYLTKALHKVLLADIIAAIIGGITFSIYALSGANEGFAILWIVVLPAIIISINRKVGTIFSIYVLVFTFTICYSPIRNSLTGLYSKTFLDRFPILCLLDFIIIMYTWQLNEQAETELIIKTYTDELTGVYNRAFYNKLCDYLEKNNLVNGVSLFSFDVNGLKRINDEKGHLVGDELIIGASQIISNITDKAIAVCRIGGDEFVSIVNCGKSEIPALEEKFLELQDRWTSDNIDRISISFGVVCSVDYPNEGLEFLYKMADDNMYKNKTSYYVRHKINRRHYQRRVEDRRKKDIFETSTKTKATKTKTSKPKTAKKTTKKGIK